MNLAIFRIPGLRSTLTPLSVIHASNRSYAARKGTREKARKKKVKVEIVKIGFIPHNQRQTAKNLAKSRAKIVDESSKPDPFGNVYTMDLFKTKVYNFYDAVRLIKESHDPEIVNEPNSFLNVDIELDMSGAKKTKFKDDFTRIISIPHKFNLNEFRTILVFSKEGIHHDIAMENGASLAGGLDLIKSIQKGDVQFHEFKYILAHPNIATEVAVLRGLLKKKYPNLKDGTLGIDIGKMVDKYSNGIVYNGVRDDFVKSFGEIHTKVGRISMDVKDLEENFKVLIQDVQSAKPDRPGDFIRRVLLWSPPFKEKFKIDFQSYINESVENLNLDDVQVVEDSETVIIPDNQIKALNDEIDDDSLDNEVEKNI